MRRYRFKKSRAIALIVVSLAAGCAATIDSYEPPAADVQHVVRKNYAIGVETTAIVGAPMIRVRDYFIRQVRSTVVRPNMDFIVSGGMTSLEVYKNLTYTVVGRTEIGGRQFAVVPVEQPFSVLIDDGGIVQSTALNGKTIMAWSFTVEPPAGQFIWESQEQVFEEGGFENFEIVFSGQDPDALHFLYREYSPDNLARPAYTQELTYPLGSETIQFRKLAIRVLRAEGSQISFVVESD